MKIIQGSTIDNSIGNRNTIHCEGNIDSIDTIFYTNILGKLRTFIKIEPKTSCNVLLEFAFYLKQNKISNQICLIDKDYKSIEIIQELEAKYPIRFLSVKCVENLLLNPKYLMQVENIKPKLTETKIKEFIQKILSENKVRFLADFLQNRINDNLEKFPRITSLEDKELPNNDNQVLDILCKKLDNNYEIIKQKIQDMSEHKYNIWLKEFESICSNQNLMCGKLILKKLKNKIFNNPLKDNDIAKQMAQKMYSDNFMPANLQEIFNVNLNFL